MSSVQLRDLTTGVRHETKRLALSVTLLFDLAPGGGLCGCFCRGWTTSPELVALRTSAAHWTGPLGAAGIPL